MASRAQIIDLRKARIERLATDMARYVLDGYAIVDIDQVDSVDEWREAARVLGRRRGLQVRTGFSQDHLRLWAAWVEPEAVVERADRR